LFDDIRRSLLNYYVRKKFGLRVFRNNTFKYRDFAESNIEADKQAVIYNTKLEGKVRIGKGTQINNSIIVGQVEIGNYTSINGPHSFVVAKHNNVKIGNYTLIAHNVSILEYSHNLHGLSTSVLNKKIAGSEEFYQSLSLEKLFSSLEKRDICKV
jgi:carbonic anhydrase/acetyltransferase-like protein (isoleucine patch superfamily)